MDQAVELVEETIAAEKRKKERRWKSRLNARPAEAEAIRAVAASAVPSSQAPVEVPCQPPAASRSEPTQPSQLIRSCRRRSCCWPIRFSGLLRRFGHPPGPAATPPDLRVQDHGPTLGMTLGIQPNNSHGLRPTIRRQQGRSPVETRASTRRWQRHQDLLGHVDFTSSQHQPGLNRSLETTTLQRIQPHKDRCIEQNVAQLLRQSIAAVELLGEQ